MPIVTRYWETYLGCNGCTYAQHFSNPRLFITYRAKWFLKLLEIEIIADQAFSWCERCGGVVQCEDPNITRPKGAFAFNEKQLRDALRLMSVGDPSFSRNEERADRQKEWKLFVSRAKRSRKQPACLRCGSDVHAAVNEIEPRNLDCSNNYTELTEHPGCEGSGQIVQFSDERILGNEVFLRSLFALDYEYSDVKEDYYGNRAIDLDENGFYLGPTGA